MSKVFMFNFNNKRSRCLLILPLLLSMLALAACSGDDKEGTPSEQSSVELTFYYNGGSYGEEQFMNNYGNAIVKKYPSFKLKFLQTRKGGGTDAMSLADLVAARTSVDILYTALGNVPSSLLAYGLQYDISDLVKTNNYDLTTLYPGAVEAIRTIGEGHLYGLPVGSSNTHLIYNKDLFDKFGEQYPKDGLTWDEAYALAQRMTRREGDVQYRGIIINFDQVTVYNQMSAGFVDPGTNRALFSSDNRWQTLVSNFVRFYHIPGNEVDSSSIAWATQLNEFTTEGKVAMMASTHALSPAWTINWDIAAFPAMDGLPGVGNPVISNFFGVTSTSAHKQEAFQAIAFLASKEFQMEHSRKGIGIPVIIDPETQAVYGEEIPFLQGKKVNTQALFPQKYADSYALTQYDTVARGALVQQMNALAIDQAADVNTALRTAAETADKAIQEQIAASK